MTDYVSTFTDEDFERWLHPDFGVLQYKNELQRALSHIKFLEAHSKMDKADIKNLENDLEALEDKNKKLERTEIKLRESCQRLGERNRQLEALKAKAERLAIVSRDSIYSATESPVINARDYLEAAKELE